MNKKKTIIPIVIFLSVLVAVMIPYIIFLFKSAGQKGGIKAPVSASDEAYVQAYKNVKAHDKYMKKQFKLVNEDVDYVSESSDTYSRSDFIDTNVRTEEVDEPDAVKTDGEYIYMTDSDGTRLAIYKVKDGKIKCMGINQILDTGYSFGDLFISGDMLIVLGNLNRTSETFINFYDVSNKECPKLVKTLLQDGYYSSSRIIGSKLYTFSYKNIDLNNYSKNDIESYVPSVDGEVLHPEDLIVYENAHSSYLVVTSVDTDEQSFESKKAVMGGATIPYVSENAIYTQINRMIESSDTLLAKIYLGNGNLAFKCDGTFKGSLLNDYSIDEYNGYVRLVTSYQNDGGELRNSLYVLDENLEKVSVIEELAPNETVKSARFMGDIVYFVTYKVVEKFYDPLFAADLSDPENPKITDYVELQGFSGYLHPYGDNKLLGIGYNTDESTGMVKSIKFTMFELSDPFHIKEECTCNFIECQKAEVLSDRKSFMYNPNDGTFGFGTFITDPYIAPGEKYEYAGPVLSENVAPLETLYSYMVFDYDEELGFMIRLNEKLGKSATAYDCKKSRGIVIGDYLYIANPNKGLSAYDTTTYERIK